MKRALLVMGILAACASATAAAGVIDRAQRQSSRGSETWSAWGGEIGVRWNRDLMQNLGIAIERSSSRLQREDFDRREWFPLRETDGLQFNVRNAALRSFEGGSLQMRGGYVLRLPDGSRIDLRDLSIRVRAGDPQVLDVLSGDGGSWFYIDKIMFELADGNRTLAIRTADVRIAPSLAERIGKPEAAGWYLGDLALETEVNITGSGAEPMRICTPYPWPGVDVPGVPGAKYEADLFMQSVSISPVGCQACTGPNGNGTAAFAPSSTLRNNVNDGSLQPTISGDALGTSSALYTANIRWQQKFASNVPPYNNDQHPYLIWNLYRVDANGGIEQIGRSGVKHAFLTTNGGCLDDCYDGHSLGRGCTDTYSTGNNDSPGAMGPRSEIIPATAQWGRCGSIFDPDCDGGQDSSGNDSWTQRMKVREGKLAHTSGDGVSFLFESWYIAREDINIYNSMATQSVNPTFSGSNWNLAGSSNYGLGSAIDRWVNPASPGAGAMNIELDAPEGHAKVAVKVTDLGGGSWRYEYAVMNFDFARAVTTGSEPNLRVVSNKGFDTFSVPLPAGATAGTTAFRDGDADAATDWHTTIGSGRVLWSAVGRSAAQPARPSLDWGSLYSYGFVSNRAPVAGNATLHVAQTGSPSAYTVATLVPGN